MAAYKDLVGQKITKVTSNPGEPKTGQMWYNSTNGKLRGLGLVEAWSSGSNTNIPRGSGYGFGTLTAGVTGTGEQGPPGLAPAATEEYNGSGWATGNNYPRTDYFISACGTQTAGLAAGGFGPPKSNAANHYNGTSWTAAAANMNVAKFSGGMFGVQTSAIYCGGDGPVPGYVATTELYNGSSWSEVADLPVAKRQFATAGTSTAGLASGGRIGPGPTVATVDQWDGSSWTAAPSLNTARRYLQGWGIQTSAIVCGGSPDGAAGSALTEMYDGTSWSETGDLATARHFGGTSQNQGDNKSGWMANGNAGPTFYSSTEEWNFSTNTITAAAFSSGGNMATPKQDGAGFGIQTAAIGAGGYVSGYTNNAQSYNGTSWTAIPNINTTRSCRGLGTQASGLICAGNTPGDTPSAATESWNGSSWTSVNSMNTARASVFSIGTYTSGLIAGGSPTSATETWDGTNWTSNPSNINTTRRGGMSAGTVSAGLICAGDPLGGSPNPEVSNATEEWDGSSWTSGNNSITERNGARGFGIQTSAVITTGANQGGSVYYATSEIYNGTNWATNPSLANARGNTQPSGVGSPIASSGVIFGGFTGSYFDSTEHFTGETSAVNIADFTTS